MNKIKKLIIFIAAIFLSGCTEYGEKRIVKLITVDRDEVKLYYYDYSQEEPAYLTEQADNIGIEQTINKLLSDNDYDLKLCEFAVCDEYTVKNKMTETVNALINNKFSTNIMIIEGDTKEKTEEYIEYTAGKYPLYSYYYKSNMVTGIVENADSSEKNIIVSSNLYKKLDKAESVVIDMLKGQIDKGVYCFKENNKNLTAYLKTYIRIILLKTVF